jgi:hypothetical protein
MSAGAFLISKYGANSGNVHPIKIQPETIAATFNTVANAPPTAAVTSGAFRARITGSPKAYGLKARYAVIKFTATPPAGYLPGAGYRIPVLNKTVWDGIADSQVASYLGTAAQVVTKGEEGGKR